MTKNNDDAEETIVFDWENTGRLEIKVKGNDYARLRFFPSRKVIKNTLGKLSRKDDNGANE